MKGKEFDLRILLLSVALCQMLFVAAANARDVDVKYHGVVNVDQFKCTKIDRSSFIHEVCYDAPNLYMLIQLKSTFYHYCALDDQTYEALMGAPSMGTFYKARIKGNYDCRLGGVPDSN